MEEFMNEPFDFKRFVLLNTKRIWVVLLSVIIGGVLFGGVYHLYRGSITTMYRSDILYEITFDRDQFENVHDYYNDYTWNDVLDSDAIAGEAAKLIGVDKADIASCTTIPTMSDIRLIHVYVDTTSQDTSRLYADALTQALSGFANREAGFASIDVLSDEGVAVVEIGDYYLRCIVSGCVVGFIAGVLILFYINAMDSRIYFESDVRKQLGSVGVYAYAVDNSEALKNICVNDIYVTSLSQSKDCVEAATSIAKELNAATDGDNAAQTVIVVEAAKDSVLALKRDYNNIIARGKQVLAVIIYYSDTKLYNAYYK